MKKQKLILIFCVLFVLVGCSSASLDEVNYDSKQQKIAEYDNDTSYLISEDTTQTTTKLVYKANLSLQTQDFDESSQQIDNLMTQYNGFYESLSVSNGSYYSTTKYRSGEYVIRIPVEYYSQFISDVSDLIYVSNKSETVDNISQTYYDTQTHIESLKIEISRLQELMKQASDMSDIITIEKALTEAENELEQYQSTLSEYDTLVDYATISISLQEVTVYKGTEQSFADKIKDAFVDGFNNFVDFLEEFTLFLIENLILIAFIVIAIIVIKKTNLLKKIKERKNNKKREEN